MLNIRKVVNIPIPDAITGLYPPDTLYFVSGEVPGQIKLYLTNSNGTGIAHIPTQDEITSSTVVYADAAPDLPCSKLFWYDTNDFVLYIQYSNNGNPTWVEAIPSYSVLEFAGTGIATTMARSDHDHDVAYVKIGVLEW